MTPVLFDVPRISDSLNANIALAADLGNGKSRSRA
jgi:hypothetical protein